MAGTEQIKALNALAPFLALANAATTPRQAADIVTQATSAQNTFVFAELLCTKAVKSLRGDGQYESHYKLLEIFTWGTWADYGANAASLPQLSQQQQVKLRLLTLLTIASRVTDAKHDLSYTTLIQQLSLSSPRELEDLVTMAIYADLVRATLDPASQVVVISSVAPLRDLAPGSVARMAGELSDWASRCADVLADLEGRIAKVKSDAQKRHRTERADAAERDKAEHRWAAGGDEGEVEGKGKSRMALSEGDAMDLDPVKRKGNNWSGRK